MKRCTRCGQIYSDELIYCLQDGMVLVDDQTDAEIPTVVRPAPSNRSKLPKLKYAAIALVILFALILAGALGAFAVWKWMASPAAETAKDSQQNASPTPSASASPRVGSPSTSPIPEVNDANARPKSTPTKTLTPAANGEDDDGYQDPGTSRINFGRGRVSESVSGRISLSRSFVLRTLGGQYLTASVGSPRDCVVFANGSSSTAFATPQGDTRLDIRNNCERPVRFSLNVAVR